MPTNDRIGEKIMKSFIVIGLGRFGSSVACELFKLGNEVLAIDINDESVQKIAHSVTHAVTADAKDESVLRSLGVRNFDCAIISMAGEIQNSVLVTLLLKEMGIKKVIAKAQNQLHSKVLQKIGADQIIFPEYDMGIKLAHSLDTDNIIDLIELSDEYSIVEITAPKKWSDKTILQLNVRASYGVNILAVRSSDKKLLTVSPTPNYKIRSGDILIMVGSNEDINEIGDLA